jgi:hypothetical protein
MRPFRSTRFRKYGLVFQGNRSVTVADRIGAALGGPGFGLLLMRLVSGLAE